MMNSRDYLDAIKARHKVTDYAVAPLIGCSKQAISAVRLGKQGFGEKSALRIAELLDKSPHEVLATLMAEKAANDEVRTVWLEIAKRFSACILLFFTLAIAPPSDAKPTGATAENNQVSLYYVK
jgi:plasmid maintenance system antidote protein VapI